MGILSQNIKKIDVNVMLIIDNDFVYYSMPFIYSLIKNNKEWARRMLLRLCHFERMAGKF